MARLQGISGGLSGRTGSFTYRQSRGQTVVSQYQPIVKNPNTQGQQDQRAKFKLMSQLASIMAPGFGTIGVTKRPGKLRPSARNAFMQINMPLIEVDNTTSGANAKIPMEQIKLTSSNRVLGNFSVANNAVTMNVVNNEVLSVKFIRVDYEEADITRPIIGQIVTIAVADGEAVLADIPLGPHTILAFGLIPTSSASRATLDNLHTPDNQEYFAAVSLSSLVADGQLVETETVGLNHQVVPGV